MSLVLRPGITLGLAACLVASATLPALGAAGRLPDDRARRDATAAKAAPGTSAVSAEKLGTKDRERLAAAVRDRRPTVTLMMVTTRHATGTVTAQIRRLGGVVTKVSDDAGYISARVPSSAVLALVALKDVGAVDLNEDIPLPDPRAEHKAGAAGASVTVAGPGPATPDSNPYMPTRDTKAVAFKTAHPTWDGRGVTIGILDTGIDLDHPALQTTTTGERKVVDWFNAVSPLEGDPTWLRMETTVSGGTFTYSGRTWTAPAGDYRISLLAESGFAATELGADLNRDGDAGDRWGVLLDPSSHTVRVDTDDDADFTDEAAMLSYGTSFQVGHFGTDDPSTAVVERVPFTVEDRELNGDRYVSIGVANAAHGSHVAGITAANGLFGGAMDGAAPGAKLVSARACLSSCSSVALVDGLVELVTNRGVDVVNISIGGLPALNDANNARAELYTRLIRDYGVQLVLSAGNSGPGINTVGDPAVADDTLAVAASVTKDTWLYNYGSQVSAANNLFNFSSRGPREDGGLKPNIAAPGSAISSIPMWQNGAPVTETGYSLPPGYGMFNGTSMAAPQTAGAVALLISAAKANGLGVTPRQLRQSLMSSADLIPNVPVDGQGTGLVDVVGAWDLLKTSPVTQTYTVSAPVCTPLSALLRTPNKGAGIYNSCLRDVGGHRPGQIKSYPVTLTRTSGPVTAQKHTVTWLGNDGTFTGPSSVTLRLNTPVTIMVKAKAGSIGDHSAILTLDTPATKGVDVFIGATVVVGAQLLAPTYFSKTRTANLQRNRFQHVFIEVPVGTKVLSVQLSGVADGSQTRFIAYSPYGVPVENTSSLNCYTNFSDPGVCNPNLRSYVNPLPGMWEFEVEARRTSALLSNPYVLQVSSLGVAVEPEAQTLPSVQAGQPTAVSWTLTNAGAGTTAVPGGGPLASTLRARDTIAHGATKQYPLIVTAGATSLTARIGAPSDAGADLDLSLYDCTSGACVLRAQAADGDSEEAVSVSNPAAGQWVVAVAGYSVPTGTTAYDFVDAVTAPVYGSLSVPTAPISLSAGASEPLSGALTAEQAPEAGRTLEGTLRLTGPQNVPLGTGIVSVEAVTTP